MVLEKPRRILDGWGLDHKVAADVVGGRRDPVFSHPQGLADHAAAIRKVGKVLLLPLHPFGHASGVDGVLLGFGQSAKAGDGIGVHHVDGEEAGHWRLLPHGTAVYR